MRGITRRKPLGSKRSQQIWLKSSKFPGCFWITQPACKPLSLPASHHKGVEHQVTHRGEVQQEIDWLGHVPIRASDAKDFATRLLQKERHVEGIGGHDRIIVRCEGFLDYR